MNKNDYINRVDSLKASEELKKRIALEAEQRSKRKTGMFRYAVAAACLALVVIAVGAPLIFVATRSAKSADTLEQELFAADSAESEMKNEFDFYTDASGACTTAIPQTAKEDEDSSEANEDGVGFGGGFLADSDINNEAVTVTVEEGLTRMPVWNELSQPVEVDDGSSGGEEYSYEEILEYYNVSTLPVQPDGMSRQEGKYTVSHSSGDANRFEFVSQEKRACVTVSKDTKTDYIPVSFDSTLFDCDGLRLEVQLAYYGDKNYAEFELDGNCYFVEYEGFSLEQSEENLKNSLLEMQRK